MLSITRALSRSIFQGGAQWTCRQLSCCCEDSCLEMTAANVDGKGQRIRRSPDFPTNKPSFFSVGWFGAGILTALGGKCFYKDSQALIIGSRMFALTRTCDI